MFDFSPGIKHGADTPAQALGRPPQVSFQYLADVHPGRHAQGVQYNINRRPVLQVRHVLDGYDGGNHAFIAMSPSHFVTRLDMPFHRQINLDYFQYPGSKIVPGSQFVPLVLEHVIKFLLQLA